MWCNAKRFVGSENGNVAIIFGLASVVIISVVGMSIDYTYAGRRQAQIGAIADAAALTTTTPTALALTTSTAQVNAVAMFNAQMKNVTGVTYNSDVNVQVVDTTSGTSVTRNTTVTWSATSSNAFSSLLKMKTMPIGGVSKVANVTAPNIDFYVLLDTSPSMGIPSTQAGIDLMVQNTSQQGGCAFACHETNPASGDVAGNPKDSNGNTMDNYALARSLGINNLRIDMMQSAVANLYASAKSTESTNKAVYRAATYTFDNTFKTVTNLTTNLDQAASDAKNNVAMLQVYSNGMLNKSTSNNDEDTQWDQALANSAYLPTPGNGTNQAGDKPQEILFIVTDGVVDEAYPGYGPTDRTYSGRTIAMPNYQKDWCSAIKNNNIRIAMLYLTYNPLPSNYFYNTYVDPFQPNIAGQLTSCASPGLFFQVNTDGDINAAMQALFAKVVGSPHLTQ